MVRDTHADRHSAAFPTCQAATMPVPNSVGHAKRYGHPASMQPAQPHPCPTPWRAKPNPAGVSEQSIARLDFLVRW